MNQRLALLLNRARQPCVRVTERRDADARQQIDVFAVVGVVQMHALAADERDRLPPVGLQNVARLAPHHIVDHHRHRLSSRS